MRIAHSSVYDNFLNRQAKGTNALNKISDELSSGKKIKLAQEDPNINISSLRLKNKINTLNQSKEVSQRAKEFTLNSDATIGQITKTLEEFKSKLAYAASQIHTPQNYEIISNELKALKDHMMSLANTSIDGKYLFSGSHTDIRPIDIDNSYKGNDKALNAVIGNSTSIQYNATGFDTFYGRDESIHKSVSTNISMFNQSMLHPKTMSKDRKDMDSVEQYITIDDNIRDLVGDIDDDTDNNSNALFYIKGRKTDGSSFKGKISLDTLEHVDALLKRIEKLYDNSVDVTLNNRGQIEITDKTAGQSLIDFHIFGAIDKKGDIHSNRADVEDIKELANIDSITIIDFNKNNLVASRTLKNIQTTQDILEERKFTFNSTFYNKSKFAVLEDKLTDILSKDIKSLVVTGRATSGNSIEYIYNIEKESTLSDLIENIKDKLGDVKVELDKNGNLNIYDLSIKDKEDSFINLSLTGHEKSSEELMKRAKNRDKPIAYILDQVKPKLSTFQSQISLAGDDIRFIKGISDLRSNVSQIDKKKDKYADENTLLLDVAGSGLTNKSFKMNLVNTQGEEQNFLIELKNDSVVFGIDGDNDGVMDGKLDGKDERKFNILNEKTSYTLGKMTNDPTIKAQFHKNADLDGISRGDEIIMVSENFKTFENSTTQKINFMFPTNIHIMSEGAEVIINNERRKVVKINDLDIPKNIILDKPLSQAPRFNTKVSVVNRVESVDNVTKEVVFKHEFPFKIERNDILHLSSGQLATADTMTYAQLMDTISMAITNNLPKDNSKEAYVEAIAKAKRIVDISLDEKGQLYIKDLKNSRSKMEFSISDSNNTNYHENMTNALSFTTNTSFTIDQPNINFFTQLDDMVKAVKYGIVRANGENKNDASNIGIQNGIQVLDHLREHMIKTHTDIGIQTRRFDDSVQRSEILITHANELKSDVEDTDIAEASMKLQQQSLGYQAMLQTMQKMNGLTLVNHMR